MSSSFPGRTTWEEIVDYGYARVSTGDQDPGIQITALEQAGCDTIVEERASGKAKTDRPVLGEILRRAQRGDTLTVWKLDRLGPLGHRAAPDRRGPGSPWRPLPVPDPADRHQHGRGPVLRHAAGRVRRDGAGADPGADDSREGGSCCAR